MDPAPEVETAEPAAGMEMVAVNPADPSTLPGYAAAVLADREAHDAAFLGDVSQVVAGSPCLPLDLRTMLVLMAAENPFLCGGRPEVEDIRQFLWHLHPAYRAGDAGLMAAFVETLDDLDPDEARAEIGRFLDDTFSDAGRPKSRPLGPDGRPRLVEAPTSFVATWVDLMASEYGWEEDRIVGTSTRRGIAITRLYQYSHLITARQCSGRSVPASARTLRLLGEWLRAGAPDFVPRPAPTPTP